MKISKRILTLVLSLVLAAGMCTTAAAASGINAYEQKILDALSGSVEIDGKAVEMPANYINQARNYLMQDGVDLTESECNQVVAIINEAWGLVDSYDFTGVTGFDNVPADLMNTILGKVQEAAGILGLTISIEGSGKPVITVVSSTSTDKVGDSGQAVKQTGISFLSTAAVFVLLAGILGYCVISAKRNQLVIE